MTADTYRRRGAEHTPLFAVLNRQWEVTAGSRQLRQRLGDWSLKHPVLVDYPDGIALMADLRRCARWRRVAASAVWRYIALVRRAKPLWALERFEQANDDVETILSTTDLAVEQKTVARLMRAG